MPTKIWKPLDNNKARCRLCSHFCTLGEIENPIGICGVRKYENGEIINLLDNRIISYNVDPVEKKPLYHYLPKTNTFSIGTMGCNLNCSWCQNSDIAHSPREKHLIQGTKVQAADIIQATIKHACDSMAFTYNEPTMFFELMCECAQLAKQHQLGTIMVSNGFQSADILGILLPLIQATNIDLKSFRESTYKKYCGATLKPVLQNLKTIAKSTTWLEVTTLIVPTVNDDIMELKDIAHFIATELGTEVPWHISAFRPCRDMMHVPHTPLGIMETAWTLGKEAGLSNVYIGNIGKLNNTLCPKCQTSIIQRQTYDTTIHPDFAGNCPTCKHPIAGIWHMPKGHPNG